MTRNQVAIHASALLRESLKPGLISRGFKVHSVDFAASGTAVDIDIVIFEVTAEHETLARETIAKLPSTVFVLVGPLGEEPGAEVPRRQVQELSADVSVSEIVRVCQQLAVGSVATVSARPSRSNTSSPFHLLPQVSDPPPARAAPSLSSSPAPLIPSSAPPSARPGVHVLGPPSIPPPMAAHLNRSVAGSPTHVLSADVSDLLEQAERRVAERGRTRMSLAPPADSGHAGTPVALTPEVQSALEDPIGEYDSLRRSEVPRPLPSRPARVRPQSAPPGVNSDRDRRRPPRNSETNAALGIEELPTRTGMPVPDPPSRAAEGSGYDWAAPESPGPGELFLNSSEVPQSSPVAQQPDSAPGTRRTPSPFSRGDFTVPGHAAAGFQVQSDPGGPLRVEAMTARPPAPSQAQKAAWPEARPRPTPRPLGDSERLPPAPPIPRDNWLTGLLRARPSTRPTDPLDRAAEADSESPSLEPRSRPTTTSTSGPPAMQPAVPQKEVPPLRSGDSVRVLARAIRERYSGVVLYEADGGIRRVV
ncbi:MAG: hypothetical protein RJA70_690, partial [Pseudomonadota bacterium]